MPPSGDHIGVSEMDLKHTFSSILQQIGARYDLGDRLGAHTTTYPTYMSLVTYAQKPLKTTGNGQNQ